MKTSNDNNNITLAEIENILDTHTYCNNDLYDIKENEFKLRTYPFESTVFDKEENKPVVLEIATKDKFISIVETNPLFLEICDLLWSKLGNIPVFEEDTDEYEEGTTEEVFLHFGIGTETDEIWNWFEWFFNISIGKRYF
jgi:hypothetical protein